jgi:hypothetical protein
LPASSTDQKLIDSLIGQGKETGEELWQLPLAEQHYMEDIRSWNADIKNVGSGYAGTITGALFLKSFVGKIPWAHLDIAGPAFAETPLAYSPKGGTGFGVRTLVAYLLVLASREESARTTGSDELRAPDRARADPRAGIFGSLEINSGPGSIGSIVDTSMAVGRAVARARRECPAELVVGESPLATSVDRVSSSALRSLLPQESF